MKPFISIACLVCLVASQPLTKAQKTTDQAASDPRFKGYRTPEGFKLEIVGENLGQPLALAFASDGSLHALESSPPTDFVKTFAKKGEQASKSITYKDGSQKTVTFAKLPGESIVRALPFDAKEGKFTRGKALLEDEAASAFLLHEGWIYLAGPDGVRRLRRSKDDGSFDQKEELVRGLGCASPHVGLSLDEAGWLYISLGMGDHFAEGRDGSRTTVLGTGVVLRCRADGSQLHVFALGLHQPLREVAFDLDGQPFLIDALPGEADKPLQGGRLLHLAEAMDYGVRSDRGPVLKKTAPGLPLGLIWYNDTRFPEPYRGLFFSPDATQSRVLAHALVPKAGTYRAAAEIEILKSDDPQFQPLQLLNGPDGAIYLLDGRKGPDASARLLRLSWAGTKGSPALPRRDLESWARLLKLGDKELLRTLASDEASDRLVAQREVVRRGAKLRPALLQMLGDATESAETRQAVLAALQAHWNDDVAKASLAALREKDAPLRRLAVEGLARKAKPRDKELHETLVAALSDDSPVVRRAVLLALGRVGADNADEVLVNALQFDDGKDDYLRAAIVRAIESLGKRGLDKLHALTDSGDVKDLEKVVDAFLMFRSRPAAEALPGLLKNYHLTADQRVALLRSLADYRLDPPLSLDPIADYLIQLPRSPKAPPGRAKERQEAEDLVIAKLAGLEVLGDVKQLDSEKAKKLLSDWLAGSNDKLRLAVIQAIGRARLADFAPRLMEVANDATRSEQERAAVKEVLEKLK